MELTTLTLLSCASLYEVWARWAEDGRADYWQECAHESRKFLKRVVNPETGLSPDYSNYDGSLLGNNRIIGDAFRFDSWRVPLNITLDYSWAGVDKEWQQEYGHKIQNFLYDQGVDSFVDQYNVDGSSVSEILGAGGYKVYVTHLVSLVHLQLYQLFVLTIRVRICKSILER